MIRVSRLADYGVVLLAEIAKTEAGPHSARGLSVGTGIPEPTVMKVLKLLGKAGLVQAVRGAHGGYHLAHAPGRICLHAVVEAVDGPVAVTLCTHEAGEACEFASHCTAQGGWQAVNRALKETLARFTLADFLKEQGREETLPSTAAAEDERRWAIATPS